MVSEVLVCCKDRIVIGQSRYAREESYTPKAVRDSRTPEVARFLYSVGVQGKNSGMPETVTASTWLLHSFKERRRKR